MTANYSKELDFAIATAQEAGVVVRDLYERAGAKEYIKQDGSPVTDADLASDQIIRARIGETFPSDAILTEEGADDPSRLSASRVWIVDPIDGTEQFVSRTGEFDILIALTVNGRPVAGVALQPPTGAFLAAAIGSGAWTGRGADRVPLAFQPVPVSEGPRLVTSKWFGVPDSMPALRRVAERLGSPEPVVNQVGIYVRNFVHPVLEGEVLIGMAMEAGRGIGWEWDFAASDVIVNAAGGCFTKLDGRRFTYNNPFPRNQGGFVLSPDPATHRRVLAAVAPELNEINNPL